MLFQLGWHRTIEAKYFMQWKQKNVFVSSQENVHMSRHGLPFGLQSFFLEINVSRSIIQNQIHLVLYVSWHDFVWKKF